MPIINNIFKLCGSAFLALILLILPSALVKADSFDYSYDYFVPDTISTPDTSYSYDYFVPDTSYSSPYTSSYSAPYTAPYTAPYNAPYNTQPYSRPFVSPITQPTQFQSQFQSQFQQPIIIPPSPSNIVTNTCTSPNTCNTSYDDHSIWYSPTDDHSIFYAPTTNTSTVDDHSVFNAPTTVTTDSHNIVTSPAPIIFNQPQQQAPQPVVYQPAPQPVVYQQPAPVYQPPCVNCYAPQPMYPPEPTYQPAPRPTYANPAPYVTLSSVPYTGLDFGPWGTALYWSILVLLCLAMAYLIVIKRIQNKVVRWLNEF